MKLLNFGSLNIDHVFAVERIVEPGQTIDSLSVATYPGGKGLNQTLAIARGGARPAHAGLIGQDGQWLRELMEKDGVDCRFVKTVARDTGSAFIQVDANGQNSIVLDGGANRENDETFCREVLAEFGSGDLLLVQNEISCLDRLIALAAEKGLRVVLNPSPMNDALLRCDLGKVSLFIMNEDEGCRITGETEETAILSAMAQRYPAAGVVLTLGSRGACYRQGNTMLRQAAFRVRAVDTTAAGDTFTGYLLAAMSRGEEMGECLALASKAAAMAVMKQGAASSIPYLAEVRAAEL